MRYYSIQVGGAPLPTIGDIAYSNYSDWESHYPDGRADPGALQVELNLEEMDATMPGGNSTVLIHGIPFALIKQAKDFVGQPITIRGGMKGPSFPLAEYQARVAGLLIQGNIAKCWGNWIGTDMSLGFVVAPGGQIAQSSGGGTQSPAGGEAQPSGGEASPQQFSRTGARSLTRRSLPVGISRPPVAMPYDGFGDLGGFGGFEGMGLGSFSMGGMFNSLFGGGGSIAQPLNFIHNLMPNMPLSSSIQETLSKVFPNANLNINISQALQLPYQDAGMYQSFEQFANYIQNLSHSILGTTNYLGVHMSAYSNTINVWDQPIGAGVVTPYDLIGQPTWIEPLKISFKTVMRADLHIGYTCTIEPTYFLSTPGAVLDFGAASEQKNNLTFGGVFLVTKVLHIGDFRNPDGANWSSNYEAVVISATEGNASLDQVLGRPVLTQ